jgi:hypothetical protein
MKRIQVIVLAILLAVLVIATMLIVQARRDADIQVATLMGTATANYNAIASQVRQTNTAEHR